MQSSDKPAFKDLLTDVLAFYRQDVSTFALGVWWEAAKPFELEQVSKALTRYALDPERGHFPPKPADLVRALSGTQTDRSLIACGKVLDAAQRVGAYTSVCFDDGLIHAAIEDIGGWIAVCRTNTDELPFLQRRFTDSYRAYANRGDVRYPAMLPGEHDLTNRLGGHPTSPPALIGDAERAKQTLLTGVTGPKTQITHAADAAPNLHRIGRAA